MDIWMNLKNLSIFDIDKKNINVKITFNWNVSDAEQIDLLGSVK